MTQSEAEALLLAGLPGPAAQLGLSDLLSAARLKLLASLPSNMQRDAERIASRFHLDPVAWFRGADPLPALQTVAQAVWSERYLRIRYRNNGEVYPRKLGPLGLVLKGGVWYLVAQSGKAIRTYRVAQIVEAEASDEEFARPKRFDLAAHWEQASRAYEASVYREQAEVKLSPRGMQLLELLGPHAKDAAVKSARRDRGAWTRCSVPIESERHAAREFMRFGEEVEVLGPPALRARIAEVSAAMAQRHARKAAVA
jgi:predicted DNA-binding transcriptional regulator YafY